MTQTIALYCAAALVGLACAFLPFRAYVLAAPMVSTTVRTGRRAALAAAFAFAVLGVGLYALVGKPGVADRPYAAAYEDFEAQLKTDSSLSSSPDIILEVFAERARRDPKDPRPHFFTGQVLIMLQKPDEAIQAFQRALRVAPNDPDTMLAIAGILIDRPRGPPPFVIAALLGDALRVMKPDDPRRPSVEARLKEFQARAGGAPTSKTNP